MRKFIIECWHSGDADWGHIYTTTAPTMWDATLHFLNHLRREGVDHATITFLQVETDQRAGPPSDAVAI